MDFINKLIKKGIFCLIFIFGFFIFVTNVKVNAATCSITLNDGDNYLVLSQTSGWSDSGVDADCGQDEKNITVKINNGTEINTTNSAVGTINSYVKSPGFYTVQYSITGKEKIEGQTFITRQIRVLPNNLNDGNKNIWLAQTGKLNTTQNDEFVRILEVSDGYLLAGNFADAGYVAKFNKRGEYVWAWATNEYSQLASSKVEINELIESNNTNIYYISGTVTTGTTTSAFIKPINVVLDTGVNNNYGVIVTFDSQVTKISEMTIYNDYIYGVGYFTATNAINTGKIIKIVKDSDSGELGSFEVYSHTTDSQYNGVTISSSGNVVAVGSQAVSANKGAVGGIVTVCDSSFTCKTSEPQIYLDQQLGNTIITKFNDVINVGERYLIVGNTRASRVSDNKSVSHNSGVEDKIVILGDVNINGQLTIQRIQMSGGTSSDDLVEIKKINATQYIAVGNLGSYGCYALITVDGTNFVSEENILSGNSLISLKDVLAINKLGETQYLFVGNTKATTIEGVINPIKGLNDSLFVLQDETKFENFENINVKVGQSMCSDNSTSCAGSNVIKAYWLKYGGEQSYPFIGSVSTSTVGAVFETIHEFENSQGIKFKIGRKIVVVETPVPGNVELGEMGIDKWYLYSRNQFVGENVSGAVRKELWSEYYYPVEDGKDKAGGTYYLFNYDGFVQDTSTGTTKNNYIKLASEIQKSNVAFQSVEKAKEFAEMQEFTRIAFVQEKYDNESGIIGFPGELNSLQDTTQNYYFVYYIDSSFGDGTCEVRNLELIGNCNAYQGYAFASLKRIKEVSELVLKNNNYYVSENNSRYNVSGNIDLPITNEFKEEMTTVLYKTEMSISVPNELYLNVEYYEIDKSNSKKYTFVATPKINEDVKNTTVVTFATNGNYKGEGKYVVKYCYTSEVCGESATFVIDRTAPIINYEFLDKTTGVIDKSWGKDNLFKLKGDANILSISDIDPYAYIFISGKKYYLQCNESIASQTCIANFEEFVTQSYAYDKENPDKEHELHIYDRAGNQIDIVLVVATNRPTVDVVPTDSNDSFILIIDFYEKNKIDSFEIKYTQSETCEAFCTDATALTDRIMELIDIYKYMNQLEKEKAKKDETYEPNYKSSIEVVFSYAIKESETTFSGGALLPKIVYDEELKRNVVVEGEIDPLPLSKGLYYISITDNFYLQSSASAGIGLEKAKLFIYENDDKWHIESVDTVANGKLPKTIDEYTTEDEFDNVFKARVPDTYKKYLELITSGNLQDSVNKTMFFTNQFIYIKFKENTYGINEIRTVNTTNIFGNPENSTCKFVIYGNGVNVNRLNSECSKISLSDLSTSAAIEALKAQGIYIVGKDGDATNGYYYYLAFTKQGFYSVNSKVDKVVDGQEGLAVEVSYTFNIDTTDPNVDLIVNTNSCNGEKDSFVKSDFVFTASDTDKAVPNIGRCSMKIDLTPEVHNGLPVSIMNKLLLVQINGETYNAYDYSLVNKFDGNNGGFLIFEEDGVWEVTFIDASKNEVTYKFRIDKKEPVISPFVDNNNPNTDITQYQQTIDVKISISEDSLPNTGNINDTILNVTYSINKETPKPVTIRNNNGSCELILGAVTYTCDISKGKIDFTFVLKINEEKKSENITLTITATDYFGNSSSKYHEFKFDNNPPYIFYNKDNYTPITIFGKDATNEDREKMLVVDSSSYLGNFICDGSTETLVSDKINCGDTPYNQGVDNGVVIEAYEAYRVANNNFTRDENGSTYTALIDGGYVNPTITLYTATYTKITTIDEFRANILNSIAIYKKEEFIKVTINDKVNPNITYYYGTSKTPISISDMYSNPANYTSCSSSDVGNACELYYMYNNGSKFSNLNYYQKDEGNYELVVSPDPSDYAYGTYYTISAYDEDVDYSDNYLPAVILANSRAKYDNGEFFVVPEGSIKLIDDKITYYNVINRSSDIDLTQLVTITNEAETYALKDTRIWQIAQVEGKDEKFSFVLPSSLGRPIIFRAKDKAGNYSSNYLETVIIIRDKIAPKIKEVSSILYTYDENITSIDSNTYIKTTQEYKVIKPENIVCQNNDTKYYGVNSKGVKTEVNCGDWQENIQYYAVVDVYKKAETYVAGEKYYRRSATLIEDENYLTKDNLVITFSEPIFKIVCSYYDKISGVTKTCQFSNTEFDYNEEKTTFELLYEGNDTYVNFNLTVYDFSENETIINYLYIDREKPIIEFNDSKTKTEIIEVDYSTEVNKETKYTENYTISGYKTEITAVDSINTRIDSQGHNNKIKNELKYSVKFYKFNHNIAYKNYVLDGDAFVTEIDGEPINGKEKDSDYKYYVLVKQPEDYILKDSHSCENGYCYILDDGNYYPELVSDGRYWTEITDNLILKDKVGVYKVVYQARDYSGNISEELIRTIYVVDTDEPDLNVNDKETSDLYGYHNSVVIRFDKEGEGVWYDYTCTQSSLICQLPAELFNPGGGDVSDIKAQVNKVSGDFNEPGIYKIFFHDRGSYITSEISYEGTSSEVMTLKYNLREYQFVIDKTPPVLELNAYTTADGKMYYKATLEKEETLYCVRGPVRETLSFGKEKQKCTELLDGTPKVKTSGNSVIYTLENDLGETLYYVVYEKLQVDERKYFYNTYYKKSGDEFVEYKIGQSYDENNVYIIKLIEIYFRDDGRYLIQAQDKAGNIAGRQNADGVLYDHTEFDIDNEAPSYNKGNTTPTGVNFWYSVPKEIVTDGNFNKITKLISKGNVKSYYLFEEGLGLNDSFFFAFATHQEAIVYLETIYDRDIVNKVSTVCSNGETGFEYSYYNYDRKSVVTECFVAQGGMTAKEVAREKVFKNINKLVFATFSRGTLFGDSTIKQNACDSSLSSDCINNNGMFKYVYLKNTNGSSISIAETCVDGIDGEGKTISCIKVNAKIVKYVKGSTITMEINGSETKDTNEIKVYSKEKDKTTQMSVYAGEISLVSDTYYIFEETDKLIEFDNYIQNSKTKFEHYNTTYYAIYVDNSDSIEVYYENDNGESSNKLMNGDNRKTVLTNHNNYYLILKDENISDFAKAYEIQELKDQNGNILEVYSYLRLQIDGDYVNINDYLVKETNRYYFRIPMSAEHRTEVLFTDRAGTVTTVIVSRSKVAPSIGVEYDNEGKDQTVRLTITDTLLVNTNTETVKIEYSADGLSYESASTTNIRKALLCNPNQVLEVYKCDNKGTQNGRNVYEVTINNVERLYGFFRVYLMDDHGNTNSFEFMYNPADLTANYVTADMYIITPSLDRENIRMISKDSLQIKWDNEFNYIILYKVEGNKLVEVCNTESLYKNNGTCGSKAENRVEAYIDEVNSEYSYSTLYYVDEGMYEAKILNRASIRIHNRCYDNNGNLLEDCKNITSETNNNCAWDSNPEHCASAFGIIETGVEKIDGSNVYTRFEIDKTAPLYNINDFVVEVPSGIVGFANNAEYTNAKVTINWSESFVRIWYTCEYVGESQGNTCIGNHGSFDAVTKKHIFEIDNKMSTKYTFWFEDFARNSTQNSSLTFTINVVLPQIEVYKLDSNGSVIPEGIVKNGDKINTNTVLKCYSDNILVNCSETYDVKLYKYGSNGFELVTTPNNIYVSDNFENRYRYVVSIKSISGYVYETLNTDIEFTIDKVAPHITVEGNKNDLWGVYKGSVTVLVDSDGKGTIYGKCIETGVNEYGDKIYSCDEENPIAANFKTRYDLTETGVYKVIAIDEIGNETKGKEIKYITIDNDNPFISVKAKSDYLEYELSENGFTNAGTIVITSTDNNPESYFMYRVKKADGEYSEWITHQSSTLSISEEGMYEVKPIDIVGNEGITRHFIIYRQQPKYYVYVNNKLNTINDIVREDAFLTWDEPKYETEAPIIKVTMNGRLYTKREKITETGEYIFVFTDLAGNISTHKLTINKSENICLNNVNLIPNKQYLFHVDNIKFSGGEGYEFKANDVVVLATPTNYFSGNSTCGENTLSYKSLDNKAYVLIDEATAKYLNEHKNVPLNITEEYKNKINELGGYVYAIIVNKDVAKKDLGFAIGENFFTKDPLGWSLIFIAGVGLIYVGLKVFVLKKRVKVLK